MGSSPWVVHRTWPLPLAFAASLSASWNAWALDEDEQAFLVRYRCEVVETLQSIRATPMKTAEDQNRFLILYWPEDQARYVQCALFDWDKKAYCEAASGYFEGAKDAPRTRFIVGKALRALVKLGFSPDDSKGNFVREFSIAVPGDFAAVADFLLSALYEGYVGRPDRRIGIEAPDASQTESEARCRAVS